MKYSVMTSKIGSIKDLDNPNFIFEPKLDGYRALCYKNGDKIKFISRNNKDLTENYPELQVIKNYIQANSCVLDGEIIAYDENGNPSFTLLQESYTANYIVFDILELEDKTLIEKPLIERKQILDKIILQDKIIEKVIYTSNGQALWQFINQRNLEGVMAKEIDGKYYPGKRTSTWLKIKPINTIECVIVGFTTEIREISSLALGLYNADKELEYIGNVGIGLSGAIIKVLSKILSPIQNLPVINLNTKDAAKLKITWVKPDHVCEVKYLELTKYKILRHAVFLRLREDKKPEECTFKYQFKSESLQ